MRVLVTGGAGYIGSHTLIELCAAGHEVVVVDTCATSSPRALDRVARMTGAPVPHHRVDIRDRAGLEQVMAACRPEAVIHFAGLKSVAESAARPLDYYDVNLRGTLSLLQAMTATGCGRIVFSSSATVYGVPDYLPYDEGHPLRPESVYGRSKMMAEALLRDWQGATPGSSAVLLRYFNPVGAHPSGRIGEDPRGVPGNLMPYIAQVAVGRRAVLSVYGDDYDTPDGTGVRDYIHVVDLARAHLAALDHARHHPGAEVFNIGTGTGYSVMQVLAAFKRASNRDIPHQVVARRPGDIACMQADPRQANARLGWAATHGLDEMCASAWAWHRDNPQGFEGDGEGGAGG
jgi:UDP-glucose 4-epimerase